MANLSHKKFINLLSYDLGKSELWTNKYTKTFVNRILKEIARNNTINIEYFGTFAPKFEGGYQLDAFGKSQWIAPKVVIEFNLSKSGKEMLNGLNGKFSDEDIEKMKDEDIKKLRRYQRVLLGIQSEKDIEKDKRLKKEQPKVEDVFNKVVGQIKERNSDLLEDEEFDESEDMEENGEEDDI